MNVHYKKGRSSRFQTEVLTEEGQGDHRGKGGSRLPHNALSHQHSFTFTVLLLYVAKQHSAFHTRSPVPLSLTVLVQASLHVLCFQLLFFCCHTHTGAPSSLLSLHLSLSLLDHTPPSTQKERSCYSSTHQHTHAGLYYTHMIERQTEIDCKASCAVGSSAKWRAEPASRRQMIRWQMIWAQMAITSSLHRSVLLFYIYSLSSLVIVGTQMYLFSHIYSLLSLLASLYLKHGLSGSKPCTPLSIDDAQFSFTGETIGTWKHSSNCLLSANCSPYVQFLLVN